MSQSPASPNKKIDPVFIHARREAIVILLLWVLCLIWTTSVYAIWGHGRAASDVDLWLGIPDWVLLSVVAPWLVIDVISVWFCFSFMRDDELGEANEGLDLEEELAAMQQADQDRVNE